MAGDGYPDELSDIKDLTEEYPAVVGFDLRQHITARIIYLITKAADRGLIITLSWHANNPVSNGPT